MSIYWFFLFCLGVLALWDRYLYRHRGVDTTLTRILTRGAMAKSGFIPYGFGFLCGHLFWPGEFSHKDPVVIFLSLTIPAMELVAWGIWKKTLFEALRLPKLHPTFWFSVGFVAGHHFWTVAKPLTTL